MPLPALAVGSRLNESRAPASRTAGSLLGPLVLALLATSARAEQELSLQPSAATVGKYEKLEFAIRCPRQYANPFDPREVDLTLVLRTPGGRDLRVPAFACQVYERQNLPQGRRGSSWLYPVGLPAWKARFAPWEVGRYEARAELRDRSGQLQSTAVAFTCTDSKRPGFVRISRQDPRFFEFSEGQPFFPIGQNLAFIGETQYVTPEKVDEIFGRLSAAGANFLRIWTCCEDWAMAIEARKSAWGRSWGWRPPFAPRPEAGDKPAGRQCVRLAAGGQAAVDCAPSHPVALRPATRYRLTGQAVVEGDGRLQVTVGDRRLPQAVAAAGAGQWQRLALEFETGPQERWLGRTALRLEGGGTAWIDGLSLTEADGGPELLWEADPNRPSRGCYNPVDCWMLDEVLAAAEKHGQYLRLCLITRDLYMKDLKDDNSPAYQQAIADAKNLLRYAVARWGYSPHVALWEYFNEIDPNLPTGRFYRELGEYLAQTDVYQHLRSTSTWHPSPKDWDHPQLDVADLHFYLRAVKDRKYRDEADAAVGNAAWLRERAKNKPALIGEFGLADEKWQPTKEMRDSRELVDFHNGLWASALSGVSGTAAFWWWERLDQRDAYPLYRPLADFLAGIPWTTAGLRPAEVTLSDKRLRTVGLQGREGAYLWLFDPEASWSRVVIDKATPGTIRGLTVQLQGLPPSEYRVRWWDTWAGRVAAESTAKPDGGSLRLAAPDFRRDIAIRIDRMPR